MAPRANWKGYLKLSLVSCAVALYPASSSSSRVSFNTLNKRTGNKVKRIYVDPETGDEVGPDDQAKGYPVSKTDFIVVSDEELDAIKIESSHSVDIEKFVPRAQIDPRYMDAPYYIAPEDKVAQEPFAVIRDAMSSGDVVGIGRVVIARRERLMMLEPWGKGLLGTVLRYGYEVRAAAAYFDDIPDLAIPADMHDLATMIVQRKLGDWDPAEFEDRYEQAVTELIRSKQAGKPAEFAGAPRQQNVVSLMDALRESIAREKGAAPAPPVAKAKSGGKTAESAPPAKVAEPAPRPMAASKRKSPAPAPASAAPAKARAAGTRKKA